VDDERMHVAQWSIRFWLPSPEIRAPFDFA
jgi:hypothetical protein